MPYYSQLSEEETEFQISSGLPTVELTTSRPTPGPNLLNITPWGSAHVPSTAETDFQGGYTSWKSGKAKGSTRTPEICVHSLEDRNLWLWCPFSLCPHTKELGATLPNPNTISHLCKISRVISGNVRTPISHCNTTHKLGESSCSLTSSPLWWAQIASHTLIQEAFPSNSGQQAPGETESKKQSTNFILFLYKGTVASWFPTPHFLNKI